jgi:hypothetical protein
MPGSGSGLIFSLKCWIRIRNQLILIRNLWIPDPKHWWNPGNYRRYGAVLAQKLGGKIILTRRQNEPELRKEICFPDKMGKPARYISLQWLLSGSVVQWCWRSRSAKDSVFFASQVSLFIDVSGTVAQTRSPPVLVTQNQSKLYQVWTTVQSLPTKFD